MCELQSLHCLWTVFDDTFKTAADCRLLMWSVNHEVWQLLLTIFNAR